ncbi:hypothetical protein C8Q77DRAFT_1256805 [Trametes polyzona]|nr:hypothetical protein C8Q77DRAFT_1256805 [Trametes polyzona]
MGCGPVDNAVRGILTVNDDILDLVAEAAREMHTIDSLSRTCKRIRARCLPILFQRCITRNHGPISRKDVPPKRLWPFVRHLQFFDSCLTSRSWTPLIRVPPEEGSGPDRWIKPTSLCKLYNATFFAKVLNRMPRLHVVSFTLEATSAHGLPWSAVRAVLTIPHLRKLSFHFLHLAPSLQPGEELALASCAPLTTFYLFLPDGRYTGACTPLEREALALILRLTCNSLEHLTLPSDEAPVHDMFTTLEWSHLCTLHMRGEPLSVGSHPVPYVSLFARMPHLQRLELELGQPIDVNPRPFWPSGFVADWPLPELRHLTLSCPQVDDLVYSALPSSLRSLSLRYAPHYITKALKETKGFIRGDSRWWWPLLWSSEVLRILRLCRLPALEHLEIEYLADDADDELLTYLGEAFPQLTSLVILRYRARDQTNVPLVRLPAQCYVSCTPRKLTNGLLLLGAYRPRDQLSRPSSDTLPPRRPSRDPRAGARAGLQMQHSLLLHVRGPRGVRRRGTVACGRHRARLASVAADHQALVALRRWPPRDIPDGLQGRPR